MVVKFAAGGANKVIHIHHLLNEYHWTAVDADHVLLVGHYPANNHKTLDAHSDVLMLPSLQAPATVHQHATDRGKAHLFIPLTKIGATQSHTAYDVVSLAADVFGPRYEPEV